MHKVHTSSVEYKLNSTGPATNSSNPSLLSTTSTGTHDSGKMNDNNPGTLHNDENALCTLYQNKPNQCLITKTKPNPNRAPCTTLSPI